MIERRLEGAGAAPHLGVPFLEDVCRGAFAAELVEPTHHELGLDDELHGGGAQSELRPVAGLAVVLRGPRVASFRSAADGSAALCALPGQPPGGAGRR
jgi:hypothetical protein